ncbi:MAG TPA: hypothetical protein VIN08_16945 [Ohtaekwangia sp.]|uniref:hypothetical protein n=1 Tax=Ohtaekwangia sp. TaxID=2066019 RepID=UPI002F929D83
MRSTIYTFLFLAISWAGYSQNILQDNLQWNSVKASDNLNHGDIVYTCSFRTNADQSVDWVQSGRSYHYTVTSTSGTWTSVTEDGEVTYQVSAGSALTGSFTFSRSGGSITIHLKTRTDGVTDLDLLFSISDVQVQ